MIKRYKLCNTDIFFKKVSMKTEYDCIEKKCITYKLYKK